MDTCSSLWSSNRVINLSNKSFFQSLYFRLMNIQLQWCCVCLCDQYTNTPYALVNQKIHQNGLLSSFNAAKIMSNHEDTWCEQAFAMHNAHLCISWMATWMEKIAEMKSWGQLPCPLLNPIIWPSNKIIPGHTLSGYAGLGLPWTGGYSYPQLATVFTRQVIYRTSPPEHPATSSGSAGRMGPNLSIHNQQPPRCPCVASVSLCMRLMSATCFWSLRTWIIDNIVFFLSLLQDFCFFYANAR